MASASTETVKKAMQVLQILHQTNQKNRERMDGADGDDAGEEGEDSVSLDSLQAQIVLLKLDLGRTTRKCTSFMTPKQVEDIRSDVGLA